MIVSPLTPTAEPKAPSCQSGPNSIRPAPNKDIGRACVAPASVSLFGAPTTAVSPFNRYRIPKDVARRRVTGSQLRLLSQRLGDHRWEYWMFHFDSGSNNARKYKNSLVPSALSSSKGFRSSW